IIAENVLEGLTKAAPRYAAEFESNYRDLLKDIDRIKGELAAVLAPLKGKTLLVYHPAFGYFADNFGLRQEAVETGGTEPTARQLEAIIRKARQEGVHVIFVQPQFAKKSAETVAKAINGSVVPIDPLSADWLKNLENIAAIVRSGLGGK
ncbi:MAG: ABC transporter substrate-binding protein, partial [Spirochaetales bacterium]